MSEHIFELMRLRALIDIQLPGQFRGYAYRPTPRFLALREAEKALVRGADRRRHG
jgi:hypothetical protein